MIVEAAIRGYYIKNDINAHSPVSFPPLWGLQALRCSRASR
jgi:hypothetical protein